MDKYPNYQHPRGGRTSLFSSCLLAMLFLAILVVVAAAALFVVFRPRDPEIQVSSVQLPGFAAANSTLRFNFDQYASVRNPNRAAFSHYDSTIRLSYAGNQVGFMFIPAGQIDGGHTQYMAASFAVDSFPMAPAVLPTGAAGLVEVESRLRLNGRVRVLNFFTHHIEATAQCLVRVSHRRRIRSRVPLLIANGSSRWRSRSVHWQCYLTRGK